MTALATSLGDEYLRLAILAPHHHPGLRAACAADSDIWDIYPVNMTGPDFDHVLAERYRSQSANGWVNYAIVRNSAVIGLTSFIDPDPANHAVQIGGTYIAPDFRGGTVNTQIKRWMIDHAISCGFTRIEFRVDTRNTRSMRAVEKLGAVQEGVLRRNRITWTSYVRDTAIYSILADEWLAK